MKRAATLGSFAAAHSGPPESLVRNLRSENEEVRLKALDLVGVPHLLTRRFVYGPGSPAKVIGTAVIKPEQIAVRYAALAEDTSEQAVLAVQIGDRMYAAVVLPKVRGWERIAVFDCWCKYDLDQALDGFVELRRTSWDPNLQRFELVLRASGGGTGIYTQDEAHFRVYRGSVRRVLSFVSRRLSCPMAPVRPCQFKKAMVFPRRTGRNSRKL